MAGGNLMPNDVVSKALGDVIEVRERLAELGNDMKHLAHDMKSVLMGMGAFVPRQEINEMRAATLERITSMQARLDQIEREVHSDIHNLQEAQTWFMRRIVGAVLVSLLGGSGIATAFAFGVTKLVAK